jgi:hypothetical protein
MKYGIWSVEEQKSTQIPLNGFSFKDPRGQGLETLEVGVGAQKRKEGAVVGA